MTVHGQFIAGVAPSLTAPVFFRLALHCWRSRFLDLEPVLDSSTTMASPSENTEAERRACEIRLRAERKAGDLRRNEDKAKGRHPPPSGGRVATNAERRKELGISQKQDEQLVRAQRPLCGIDDDGLEVRSREGQDMPQPSFVLVSGLLVAAGAAVILYTLAHDALGLSRHLIMSGSFALAGGLAVVSVVTTIRRAK
jgi:hypothetical protein